MWILILSMFYAGESVHVDHVPGFTSQSACMVAANAYVRQINDPDWRMRHALALCVSTG